MFYSIFWLEISSKNNKWIDIISFLQSYLTKNTIYYIARDINPDLNIVLRAKISKDLSLINANLY